MRHSEQTAERHANALMTWHVVSGETGGAFCLGEVTLQPGDEPPMHIHAREDETWYVLEGRILFQRGMERKTLTAGDSILLPRGIPHGFAVQSPAARILHLYTPGGIEQAFRSQSVPADAPFRELDPKAMAAAFEQQGVTFVGPPLPVLLASEQGQV